MAKKLSKISKELKVGISVIAEFLNNNGYDCEESPDERIPEEAIEFLRNNISAYIQLNKLSVEEDQSKQLDVVSDNVETPVEIKIIDRITKEKLLIENIIGFTDFSWDFSIAKFHGECSQPVKFSAFDEIISKILLKGEMSLEQIGQILGLNTFDEAEKAILLSAVSDLRKDNMIDGDESYLYLTNTGKQYAQNGVKFSTFERNFELYIDSTTGFTGNSKKIFERLKSQKQQSFSRENLPQNIEDVKPLAEIQAPEIHFPQKNFILRQCSPTGIEGYKALVWVVLLENFRDQTIRALVYDENHDCIIPELSEALNANEEIKQAIFEKLINKSSESDDGLTLTDEEKDVEQVQLENDLIVAQAEYDQAVCANDHERASEISSSAIVSKRHFNTVEFEVELKRLFEETKCDMWIISPWIKKYATMQRLPFFEQYLKKGGRIFIAYSKPESPRDIDEMADAEAFEKLRELEQKYQNFYLNQLDPFHFKYVWVRGAEDGNWFYSGSFNILSFFVKKGLTKVRQEMMSKIEWGQEEETYFANVLELFGLKYLREIRSQLEIIKNDDGVVDRKMLQSIKAINFTKLKPFESSISDGFDNQLLDLQIQKENLYKERKSKFFNEQLGQLSKRIGNLERDSNISVEKKKEVQSILNTLKNEFPDYIDELSQVQTRINALKLRDLSKLLKSRTGKVKSNKFNKKR